MSALARVSALALEATREIHDRVTGQTPPKGGEVAEIRAKLDSRFGPFSELQVDAFNWTSCFQTK